MRPAVGWLALLGGVGCCIATLALAVAAKGEARTIGLEGVIALVVGLALIRVGGRLLTDRSDGPDR
jgi:hypothetical protein